MPIQVNPRQQGVSEQLIERYREVAASTLGHLTEQGHLRDIHALLKGVRMVGNVVTVKLFPPDGSVLRDALVLSQPGDVLVIECAGDDAYACWGELRTLAALIKGLAGVVIAGPATDVAALRQHRLPIFCRGAGALTTRGIGQEGEVNGPIQIAGVTVHPGDLAIGDDDGVFILSPEQAAELWPRAQAKEHADRVRRVELLERLNRG